MSHFARSARRWAQGNRWPGREREARVQYWDWVLADGKDGQGLTLLVFDEHGHCVQIVPEDAKTVKFQHVDNREWALLARMRYSLGWTGA